MDADEGVVAALTAVAEDVDEGSSLKMVKLGRTVIVDMRSNCECREDSCERYVSKLQNKL